MTYTNDDGGFEVANIPTGDVTVAVRYAGLQDASIVANVIVGQAVSLDVEMKPQSLAAADGESAQTITVVRTRSGQAAALMKRRSSVNAVTAVDADAIGDYRLRFACYRADPDLQRLHQTAHTDAALRAFRHGAWQDISATMLGSTQESWLAHSLKTNA